MEINAGIPFSRDRREEEYKKCNAKKIYFGENVLFLKSIEEKYYIFSFRFNVKLTEPFFFLLLQRLFRVRCSDSIQIFR